MVNHGHEMGADGIAAMRFESNAIAPGVIEVVAYGTAVSLADAGNWGGASAAVAAAAQKGAIPHAMVSTMNELPGQPQQRLLGLAQGITVRSRNVVRGIAAGLKAGFLG